MQLLVLICQSFPFQKFDAVLAICAYGLLHLADTVRGLAAVPGLGILSASHDG